MDPDGREGRAAPRERADTAPSGEVKLRLYPKELEALVFARKIVSAWTCPAEDISPFGPDKRPGTRDDACKAAVAGWSLENEAARRLNHRSGHKVLVRMTTMQSNRLMADAGDGLCQGLPLTPLPRPDDKPAPRLITEQ